MLNDILRKKRKSKMRKPEYPVFLTYGPIHVFPLGWIKRWKEDIICICQRLRYGYCYRDAWAIDQWFLVIIPNMLNDLRINGHGYPGSFTGTEEENVRKWNRILEHMEFLFREANEETCHRKNPYEEAYDQAREAFTRKYGMFGEKLKTEEEKEQEKDKGYYCVHYIDIKGNKIDLKKDVEQGIDISKVKVTANGTLDKDTGIITVDDVKKPVTYELVISDCYWCCLERF